MWSFWFVQRREVNNDKHNILTNHDFHSISLQDIAADED